MPKPEWENTRSGFLLMASLHRLEAFPEMPSRPSSDDPHCEQQPEAGRALEPRAARKVRDLRGKSEICADTIFGKS